MVARRADVTLWDPKFTNDNDSLWAQVQIFATLLQNSPDGKGLNPYLAESYEVSPDATQFTFKLHDNAKFCDGTPVTAEDVKFSFERAMQKDSAVSWQYPSNPKIEAVDPLTVKITLEKPNVAFPSYLTSVGTRILSKAYVEKNGDAAQSDKPLGSGAFCLAEWTKGEQVVLKPNPGYWEAGKPYLDEVRLKAVTDDNARVLQVQSGDVDIALDIPYNQVDALSQSPDLKGEHQHAVRNGGDRVEREHGAAVCGQKGAPGNEPRHRSPGDRQCRVVWQGRSGKIAVLWA